MSKLILLRHLESKWNLENRFSGWVDMPLSKEGIARIEETAQKVFNNKIDTAYSSPLFRNQDTLVRILNVVGKYPIFIYLDKGKMKDWGNYTDISEFDLPVYISEALNERYYGMLQGLNKEEAAKKFGEEKVHLWRRSYNIAPPGGESLKDVIKRTTPFYKKYIENDLKNGKNVLVVASHNAFRAIIKYIEKIPDNDIIDVEIPFGGLIIYEVDKSLYYGKIQN
jgi:2,3-bisphosphoglycerate-dependent phosphoglycerate mutase